MVMGGTVYGVVVRVVGDVFSLYDKVSKVP